MCSSDLINNNILISCNQCFHSLIFSFYHLFQRIINREKQRSTRVRSSREKILRECRSLCDRLQECSAKFLAEEKYNLAVDPSSLPEALDLLAASDDRIQFLIAQVKFLLVGCCHLLKIPAWQNSSSSSYKLELQVQLRIL